MVKYKTGDLLTSDADIILHQVNCQGVMGAGLARQIRNTYPKHYDEYRAFCKEHDNSRELLGKHLVTIVGPQAIVGLFGQHNYGKRDVCYTSYSALRKALYSFSDSYSPAGLKGRRLAAPYLMGCGLTGGDWNIVEQMLINWVETIGNDLEIWRLL